MKRAGVIVALVSEARAIFGSKGWSSKEGFLQKEIVLKGTNLLIVISGQGGKQAASAAAYLKTKGVNLIINVGVAGALNFELVPGNLVVPSHFLSDNQPTILENPQARELTSLLNQRGINAKKCKLVTTERTVATSEEKINLSRQTGACAVDMEAYWIARDLEGKRDIRLIVLKAISDHVNQALPEEITSCMRPDGNMDYVSLIKAILRKPSLLITIMRLGRGFKLATLKLKNAISKVSASD